MNADGRMEADDFNVDSTVATRVVVLLHMCKNQTLNFGCIFLNLQST